MARKFVLQSVQVHSRSISLPARLHPNSLSIEEDLNKLRTTHSGGGSGGEYSCIQSGLIRLAELYNNIEDLINSPCSLHSLYKQQRVKMVEDALDRSVKLLDACSNARELILNMKEQVQELQSALRRRRVGGDYSSMESKLHAYMSFRKKSRKAIAKCLRELKRIDSNNIIEPLDHGQLVLRESSALTVSIFRSVLLFLPMPAEMKRKGAGGWSLIRKLMTPAASERSQEEIFNEVGNVDIAVHCLHRQIRKDEAKIIDVKIPLKRLERLDVCIRDIESGLDCLYRRLIQNRVSLLNILTH